MSKPMAAPDYQKVAESIRKMVDFSKTMQEAGISRRAVVALLVESTKLSKRDIELVLNGIDGLKNWVLINS